MKQYESVIKVMEEKGGYATLGQLYQYVDVSTWKTKTPFASIRRIVQDDRFFFKIRPGLWALNSHKEIVLKYLSIDEKSTKEKIDLFNHTYYQGLIVEIGNIEGYDTFVPNQDKNKIFLSKPLLEYATLGEIFKFTYDEIIRKIKYIDVIWFNKRQFPEKVFEIEHTTNFQNSLIKFIEIQDFNIKFRIISDKNRENKFKSVLGSDAFKKIKNRVNFYSYEKISEYHAHSFEYYKTKKKINL